MANVTQGLFGFDPAQQAQQREGMLQQQVNQHVQMSPVQAARAAMFRAGSQAGSVGASLLGIKDPELEAQTLMQQTAKTLDLTDHAAVRNVANQWLQSGNQTLQNKALQLNDVADRAEETANQRTKEKASIELAARKAAQQAAFSKEYAAAPDADARLAVTRKYAEMPDLIKLDEAALARKEKAEEAAAARRDKAEAAAQARAETFANQRFIAEQNNMTRRSISADAAAGRRSASNDARQAAADLKATALQEKTNNQIEKQQDLDAKASRSAAGSIAHSTQMINDVKDTASLVKFETTGRTGQAAAAINPGGDAGKLRTRIATIKANLGFDRLQKMRDESPTGGALGQVAVQELEALQSSVASLSPLLDERELTRNLNKIEKHYSTWSDAVAADEKARVARRGGQQGINIPGATARNKLPIAIAPSGWGKAVEH